MNEEILESYLQAGHIAKKARDHAASMVRPGVRIVDLVETIEQEILDQGAGIAFPLNISRNEFAAHDTAGPGDEREFLEGDVVKVDLGAHINGYVADTAVTVDLGGHAKLVESTEAALKKAISLVRPGVTAGELGTAIQHEIEKRGFKPVSNLTGHGLGKFHLHGEPTIPNVSINGGAVLEEGTAFAIEPFATTGSGHVTEGQRMEIYQQTSVKPVRMPSARKVIEEIRDRRSLPFSRRWLKVSKAELALATLRRSQVVYGFPVLHDIPGSFVSQHEHTLIVTEDGCIVTTR